MRRAPLSWLGLLALVALLAAWLAWGRAHTAPDATLRAEPAAPTASAPAGRSAELSAAAAAAAAHEPENQRSALALEPEPSYISWLEVSVVGSASETASGLALAASFQRVPSTSYGPRPGVPNPLTDAEGRARIACPAGAEIELALRLRSGQVVRSAVAPLAAGETRAHRIVLPEAGTLQIDGFVFDTASGAPLPGALVYVAGQVEARTDREGRYRLELGPARVAQLRAPPTLIGEQDAAAEPLEFEGLLGSIAVPPADEMVVWAPGHEPARAELFTGTWTREQPLEHSLAVLSGVDLELHTPAKAEPPAREARLELRSADGARVLALAPPLEWRPLPDGRWLARASFTGLMADDVVRCELWVEQRRLGRTAAFRSVRPWTQIALELGASKDVRGSVRDSSGQPVADAEVVLNRPGTGDYRRESPQRAGDDRANAEAVARTDAEGRFEFRTIPVGELELAVFRAAGWPALRRSVELRADGEPTEVEIRYSAEFEQMAGR